MRWIGNGTRPLPRERSTASERVAFQRQRAVKSGEPSSACSSTSPTVCDDRKRGRSDRSKVCGLPSESTIASSVAAACSSMLNDAQKRLRSASPNAAVHARAERRVHHELHAAGLVEEALGEQLLAASARSRPPASARRRSARAASRPTRRARTRARATRRPRPGRVARARAPTSARSSETSRESSSVRAGASPSQNGIVGGAPCASVTRTTPDSTRRMRQLCVPSRNTSPAMLSIAQSSFTRADRGVVGIEHDLVVAELGNRAARHERRQARAAPAAQPPVHLVAVQARAALAARRLEAVASASRARPRSPRARARGTARCRAPARRARPRPSRRPRSRDDLLRQDVERRVGNHDPVEPARAHRAHQRGALDQLVARGRAGSVPWGAGRARDPSGRCAAAASRCCAASRSGRRARSRRCRCRARATRWRPAPAARPPSAAPRRAGAARATGCRGARRRARRRSARRAGAPAARPAGACWRRSAWCGASRCRPRASRPARPTAPSTRPRPGPRSAARRSRDRDRAGGRGR